MWLSAATFLATVGFFGTVIVMAIVSSLPRPAKSLVVAGLVWGAISPAVAFVAATLLGLVEALRFQGIVEALVATPFLLASEALSLVGADYLGEQLAVSVAMGGLLGLFAALLRQSSLGASTEQETPMQAEERANSVTLHERCIGLREWRRGLGSCSRAANVNLGELGDQNTGLDVIGLTVAAEAATLWPAKIAFSVVLQGALIVYVVLLALANRRGQFLSLPAVSAGLLVSALAVFVAGSTLGDWPAEIVGFSWIAIASATFGALPLSGISKMVASAGLPHDPFYCTYWLPAFLGCVTGAALGRRSPLSNGAATGLALSVPGILYLLVSTLAPQLVGFQIPLGYGFLLAAVQLAILGAAAGGIVWVVHRLIQLVFGGREASHA